MNNTIDLIGIRAPKSGSTMNKFENYSKNHTHFYTGEIQPLLEEYFRKVKWVDFVDIGCGDGALLHAMREKGLTSGKNIYAVDLSEKRIQRTQEISSDFKCFVDDAQSLKTIRDDSIDFAVAVNVIEHVNDQKMISVLKRVVRLGGTVYLSTTFKKWYGWYPYRNNGKWVLDPTHLREYTKDSQLFGVLESNGFKILESVKNTASYPISELLLRVLKFDRRIFKNRLMRSIRKIRLPIVGYYKWEIVCQKSR